MSAEEKKPKTWSVGTLTYTTTGLVILFAWLLGGDFLENMKERGLQPVLQLMLKRFEASNFLVGLLIGSLPTAIGMIIAPFVMMKSDRHRGRWGRRIPFIAIPLPFAVGALAAIAFAPFIGSAIHAWLGPSSPGLNACTLVAFIVLWTIYDIASTFSSCVVGAFINDVVPPQVIGRFYGLFRLGSLIGGMVFNYFFLGHAEQHYFWLLLGMAILYGIGYGMICLMVKEGEYPPPEPLAPGHANPFTAGLVTYVKECFAQPFYLLFFSARTLGMLAFGPLNAFSIFYAKSLGVSMDVLGKFTAIGFGLSIVITYTVGALADRFHPLRVGLWTMAVYAVVAVCGWFFISSAPLFLAFGLAHTVISGIYMTGTAALQQRMLPRDRFGQFSSAGGIIGSLAFMVMQPAVGLILDHSGHNYRLTYLMNGGIAIFSVVLLWFLYRKYQALGGDKNYVAP